VTGALGADETRALRMRAQGLAGARATDVHAVVRSLAGVQAQDWRFAPLAIRPRSSGLLAADVDRARDEERSIVWTWAMRGTLHLIAAQDVAWMVGLLGPVFAAAGRRRRLALGLDDELCARALVAIRALLGEHGPLTRAQLVRRLAERRVQIEHAGQAPAHLVAYAAMRGLICRGAPLGAEPTYVLLESWLGTPIQAVEPDRALAELARRYLAAHGPAAPEDFATWSGLGVRRARRGVELIAGELRDVGTIDRPAWMLTHADADAPALPAAHVALLGHFDPYLLGFRNRDLVLDPRFGKRIQAGGGFIKPAVLAGGRVVGTWRGPRRDSATAIDVEPFEELDADVLAGIERERADLARFLAADLA
jgi:hypothetical protein